MCEKNQLSESDCCVVVRQVRWKQYDAYWGECQSGRNLAVHSGKTWKCQGETWWNCSRGSWKGKIKQYDVYLHYYIIKSRSKKSAEVKAEVRSIAWVSFKMLLWHIFLICCQYILHEWSYVIHMSPPWRQYSQCLQINSSVAFSDPLPLRHKAL